MSDTKLGGIVKYTLEVRAAIQEDQDRLRLTRTLWNSTRTNGNSCTWDGFTRDGLTQHGFTQDGLTACTGEDWGLTDSSPQVIQEMQPGFSQQCMAGE